MNGPIEPTNVIISCSSGNTQNSAISIIRISGFLSKEVFIPHFSVSINKLKSRMLVRSNLIFEDQVLDDVMIVLFEAPNSFTGENVLEINCHGNKLNVDRIINKFKTYCGFRDAKPGEFTLRALKNKKLTVSQVEGLDLLLNSQHGYAFSHGLSLLNGELSTEYKNVYQLFKDMKVKCEILMDFSEDVGDEEGAKLFKQSFLKFRSLFEKLFRRVNNDQDSFLNPKLVLFGPVNSGKSTLFNHLVGSDRSIVSNVEGTTRDYVSESFNAGDITCNLIDTAGLRETSDEIEKEGINRTKSLVKNAFFKVFLVKAAIHDLVVNDINASEADIIFITGLDEVPEEFKIKEIQNFNYAYLGFNHAEKEYHLIKSFNPIIEGGLSLGGPIEPAGESGPIEPAGESGPIEPAGVSGPIEPAGEGGPIEPAGEGGPIEPPLNKISLNVGCTAPKLLKLLISGKYERLFQEKPVLLNRHKNVIGECYEAILCLEKYISSGEYDLGIITSMVEELEISLEELIGIVPKDDVLDSIFSNFCIGK